MTKQEKTTPMEVLKQRLRNADDETLIRRFHAYPLKSLIVNVISLLLFITAFAMEEMKILLFLGLGAVSIIVFQMIVPPYTRRAIAQVMMERNKTEKDTNLDEFYYYYRCEAEVLGEVKKSAAETIFKVFGVVVKIVNVIFNLLSAAIALFLALAIAVIFGGALWLCHLLWGGNRTCLDLAIQCTVPAKWAFAFLLRVLSLKDYIGLGEKVYDESAFVGQKPKEESQMLADATLKRYISTPNILLQHCVWDGFPSLTVIHNSITFKGYLIADSICHKDKIDLHRTLQMVGDDIRKELQKQLNVFYSEHPNAGKVEIFVEINGEIGA